MVSAEARQAPRPAGLPFRALLDVSELDERGRPGPSWTAGSLELSRSHVVISSRRLCYPDSIIALAVHLIDDRPVPLMGRVISCGYSDDGLYRVDLDLMKIPENHAVFTWMHGLPQRLASEPGERRSLAA